MSKIKNKNTATKKKSKSSVNKKQSSIRKKRYYVKVKEDSNKISRPALITIVIISIGLISSTYTFAIITQEQYNIDVLEKKLKDLKNQKSGLEVKIAQSYNIKDIEAIATNKLGMSKPTESQIIYIEVDEPTEVIQQENIEQQNSKKLK